MSNVNNNKDKQDLQTLHKVMRKYPGSVKRTAEKLECSTTWIYKVLNHKVQASDEAVSKVVQAALDTVAEMKEDQARKEAMKKEALRDRQNIIHNSLVKMGELAIAAI